MARTRKILVAAAVGALVTGAVTVTSSADAAVVAAVDIISLDAQQLVVLGPPDSSGDRVGTLTFTVDNNSDVSLFNIRVDFQLLSGVRLAGAPGDNCPDANTCFLFPPAPRSSQGYSLTLRRAAALDGQVPSTQELRVTAFSAPGVEVDDHDDNNRDLFGIRIG